MEENKGNLTAVVGIGNELRGDDGIGSYIISALEMDETLEKDRIQLFNAGQDPFFIIGIIEKYEKVIIVDCAMIDKKPGEFIIVDSENIKKHEKSIRSVHSFSIVDAVDLSCRMYPGRKISYVCIQPKDMNITFRISDELKEKTPEIISSIKELLIDE